MEKLHIREEKSMDLRISWKTLGDTKQFRELMYDRWYTAGLGVGCQEQMGMKKVFFFPFITWTGKIPANPKAPGSQCQEHLLRGWSPAQSHANKCEPSHPILTFNSPSVSFPFKPQAKVHYTLKRMLSPSVSLHKGFKGESMITALCLVERQQSRWLTAVLKHFLFCLLKLIGRAQTSRAWDLAPPCTQQQTDFSDTSRGQDLSAKITRCSGSTTIKKKMSNWTMFIT